MKIFIMRHGEAEHYAQSDAERALTERGRSASAAVAKACVEQGYQLFDKVIVSPYLRAQQTWQEVATLFDAKQIEVSPDRSTIKSGCSAKCAVGSGSSRRNCDRQ